MATFQINEPVLIAGQHFEVRYRLLPNGPWITITDQTNAPFNINGLDQGRYQLEVSLAYDDVVCDPSYYPFEVGDCDCLEVTVAEILEIEDIYYIHVEYNLPDPQPACGWIVNYGCNGEFITYESLPDDEIYIYLGDTPFDCYDVSIQKDCCIGPKEICYSGEVCVPPKPPCTPSAIVSQGIFVTNGNYYLKLVVNQSVPATLSFTVNYNQSNNLATGVPDTGSVSVPGNAGTVTIMIPINPNQNIVDSNIMYSGVITDSCGQAPFNAKQCCPDGYTYEDGMCVKVVKTLATLNPDSVEFTAAKKFDGNYTRCNTSLYSSFNPNGTGVYTTITTPYWSNLAANLVDGPMNRTAIWNGAGNEPTDVFVTIAVPFSSPVGKIYYVGLGMDNIGRVRLNCSTILEQNVAAMYAQHVADGCSPFASVDVTYKMWHIIPIFIPAGKNILEIACKNVGPASGNPGAFGFQIYDNTAAEIAAASSDSDLNIVESSERYVGQTLEAFRYQCPGDDCFNVVEENGVYYCYTREVLAADC